jgi:hypothetical protein
VAVGAEEEAEAGELQLAWGQALPPQGPVRWPLAPIPDLAPVWLRA